MAASTAPISSDDGGDVVYARRGCCLFAPFIRAERPDVERERWWTRGWRKVREWSELVAGPRWKTFIRRFNRRGVRGGGGPRLGKFQYDPLSYALNFDEEDRFDGEDGGYRSFSSRFAVPLPASAKSSMDLGRNGPNFSSSTTNPVPVVLL